MSSRVLRMLGQLGLLAAGVLFVYSFIALGKDPPEGALMSPRTESMRYVTYGGIICAGSFVLFMISAIMRTRSDSETHENGDLGSTTTEG